MRCIARMATAAIAVVGIVLGAGLSLTGASAQSTSTTPRGVTLSGLQNGMSTTQLEAEISAIQQYWNANTVRLQVEQDKLTWKSGNCPIATDPVCGPYLAQIETVVNYALSLGLKVVVNDQTESAPGYTANEPMPTHATTVFWQTIAPVWAGNSNVIYDLFNEPRITAQGNYTWKNSHGWDFWRNGGVGSDGNTYLGMQSVLNTVRNQGASNPVWAEGMDAGATLAGIRNGTGTPNIANDQLNDPDHLLWYSFHHPEGSYDSADWWEAFGYLSNLSYRVVDGEWNNSVDGAQYCIGGMPGDWSPYTAYLQSKSVGMTGWTIGPVGTVDNVPNMPVTALPDGKPDLRGVSTPDTTNAADGSEWSLSAPTTADLNTPQAYEFGATEQGNPTMAWNCANENDASEGANMQTWFGSLAA